jgi:hypothetical protein
MIFRASRQQWSPGSAGNKHELNYTFRYLYEDPRPHSPSRIGSFEYEYDVNGNLILKEKVNVAAGQLDDKPQDKNLLEEQYIWDEENRLREVHEEGRSTEFLYNVAGERTVKRGQYGETIYSYRLTQYG